MHLGAILSLHLANAPLVTCHTHRGVLSCFCFHTLPPAGCLGNYLQRGSAFPASLGGVERLCLVPTSPAAQQLVTVVMAYHNSILPRISSLTNNCLPSPSSRICFATFQFLKTSCKIQICNDYSDGVEGDQV